ncbi:MAG TPA: GIY-YIG nuclease family protein [Calidithermus sp.]|nr:GIY-YIG nuclease family protein [Calidithermus sp.]
MVEAGGRYRIGCSSDPERRARELRGTLLDWVAIPFGYDLVESRVRERYAARRLHGEWLALSAGDLAAFGRVVREAVRDVRRVHPLALRRRPPGRPALTPEERRERARARKRRWRDCRRARLGPALGAR